MTSGKTIYVLLKENIWKSGVYNMRMDEMRGKGRPWDVRYGVSNPGRLI